MKRGKTGTSMGLDCKGMQSHFDRARQAGINARKKAKNMPHPLKNKPPEGWCVTPKKD